MTFNAEKLFSKIPKDDPVLVAVSGGSDSIALLLLANIWAQKNGVILQAVTVDHGLRPEAAAEAAFVASICAGLGVPHVTLAWEGMKPSFGIQEAARESRYSLMDDFAHEIGCDVILTGHTRDDQIETVLMRSQRFSQSGEGRGLSGMGRQTWLYGGTRIFRPLLGSSRDELRAFLSENSQSWIEDPSNLDESYERVRIRKHLKSDPQLAEKVHRFGKVCGRLRSSMSLAVVQFLKANVSVKPGPVFVLKRSNLEPSTNPVAAIALQTLIAVSGGQAFMVPRHRLVGLFELIENSDLQAEEGGARRMTIGGACVEFKKDVVIFYRESRNQTSLMLDPGEAAIWDGRMHIYNGLANPVFIEVAGRQQLREFELLREAPYPVMPRAALRSTPMVHVQTKSGNTEPCLPLIESNSIPKGLEIRIASPAIEHFCPEFDAPLRLWVRSLDQYTAASLQP